MKKKPFAFRISESTYKTLKQKSKRGKVTMTEFLERAITDKEIVVVDGIQELISELKAMAKKKSELIDRMAEEARNTTGPIMSSGTPQRPAGIRSRMAALRSSSARRAAVLLVAM